MLLSPIVILIAFGIILTVCLLIAVLGTHNNKTRLEIFVGTLTGCSVFITVLFYYNLVNIQQDQQELDELSETKHLNSEVYGTVLSEIRKSSVIIPNFTKTLLPDFNARDEFYVPDAQFKHDEDADNTSTDNIPNKAVDEDSIEGRTEKYILSYKIFSVWQIYTFTLDYLFAEEQSLLCNFLIQAQSKPLREQWENMSYLFSPSCQLLVKLMFKYLDENLPINGQDYSGIALKIINDPEYKNIKKKNSKRGIFFT